MPKKKNPKKHRLGVLKQLLGVGFEEEEVGL